MISTLPVASEARITKLSAADKKIFRGTAAEVLPWMSNEDILTAEAQGRAFKSMLDGPRATEAVGFCNFLLDRLAIAV